MSPSSRASGKVWHCLKYTYCFNSARSLKTELRNDFQISSFENPNYEVKGLAKVSVQFLFTTILFFLEKNSFVASGDPRAGWVMQPASWELAASRPDRRGVLYIFSALYYIFIYLLNIRFIKYYYFRLVIFVFIFFNEAWINKISLCYNFSDSVKDTDHGKKGNNFSF